MQHGSAKITDQMIQAAIDGSQVDRDFILTAMSAPLRAMVAARLAPTAPNVDSIEDLAQECAVALCNGLARLRTANVPTLRSYASRIVATKVADWFGRTLPAARRLVAPNPAPGNGSSPNITMDIFPSGQPSPRSALARAEVHEQILAELGRLRDSHREVITMAFYDELSLDEISERLSLSKVAVSMLLFRALKAVRKSLTGNSRVSPANDRRAR